jgi:hypothetical protein
MLTALRRSSSLKTIVMVDEYIVDSVVLGGIYCIDHEVFVGLG